jgi:uncharacterized protein YjiS (DUF1127 family)
LVYPCYFFLAALQQNYFASQHRRLFWVRDSGESREKGLKMLTSLIRFLQAWKQHRRALCELSQLSDRELADIGISRSEIPRVAWEHAQSCR